MPPASIPCILREKKGLFKYEVLDDSLEGANTTRLERKRAVYPILDLKKDAHRLAKPAQKITGT